MKLMLWIGLPLLVLVVTVVGLSAYGRRHWRERVRSLSSRLEAARVEDGALTPSQMRYDARELNGLPAPVQRYFRAVLKDGQPVITAATVNMAGSFNLSPTAQQWRPFTSQQCVVTRRPGFLWDARISMLPGVAVHVVDSYIAGEGLLRAAIQGVFTVADTHGDSELGRGEFMRFFAEAPWYPTALLPSQGVRWEAVNDTCANATMVDGPITLTLLFRFSDTGLMESFRAEARGAGAGKKVVMLPWEGLWSNYQVKDGITVPFTGEVAWMRPEGRQSYFVGTVTSLAYEFSP